MDFSTVLCCRREQNRKILFPGGYNPDLRCYRAEVSRAIEVRRLIPKGARNARLASFRTAHSPSFEVPDPLWARSGLGGRRIEGNAQAIATPAADVKAGEGGAPA
jgi:hypothetical protein